MSSDLSNHEIVIVLATNADHLNAIDVPNPNAIAKYEILSGSLVWSDEIRPDTPYEVINALRSLFAYRTQLIRTNSEPQIEVWTRCVAMFPKWIGFLPERRKPTPELLAEYRRGDVSLRWWIRNFERNPEAKQERCGKRESNA